jgi:hypothetical protein
MVDTLVSDSTPAMKQVHIFSDESGKSQEHFVVGTLWVLQANQLAFLSQKVDTWKTANDFKNKEIHFKKINKNHVEKIKKFTDLIVNTLQYLGFKVITVKNY